MGKLSVAVSTTATDEFPLTDLERLIAESPLLTLSRDPEGADLRVEGYGEGIFRFYRRGTPLAAVKVPVKRPQALPRKLQGLLEHLAAYSNLEQLQPPNPFLGESVTVEFLRLLTPASRTAPAQVAPVSANAAGELEFRAGESLAIAVSHRALNPLYVYGVSLDTRRLGVTLVYPYTPDQPAKVLPGETLLIGSGPTYTVELQLPPQESSGLDLFKIFVSNSPIDPKVLIIPSLGLRQEPSSDPYGAGSRLDRDLRQAILGQTGLTPFPDFYRDPWWCTQQWVRTVAS
ncbi:MAG: hypothetical protein Q6L49_05430 [Thermostichales cyanobacterium HHBFW_bins_127]